VLDRWKLNKAGGGGGGICPSPRAAFVVGIGNKDMGRCCGEIRCSSAYPLLSTEHMPTVMALHCHSRKLTGSMG
jgi:hypothetical protein